MKSKISLSLFAAIILSAQVLFAASLTAGAEKHVADSAVNASYNPAGKQFYQLIIYHLKDKNQEERVDKYLSEAYLPAAHQAGVKTVGVFKTMNIDTATDKKIYVLLAFPSLNELYKITKSLAQEQTAAGKDYVDAAFDNAPYLRKETILMEAFSAMPVLKKPEFNTPKATRIYELRSYEGATEKLYHNKVSMFNEGNETEIFERIGSQPVFYGEVIAGSRMPNLMYMTTYSDVKSRDEHWKTFGNDPKWKTLSGAPEYQHNVSKADIIFLNPAEYSDL